MVKLLNRKPPLNTDYTGGKKQLNVKLLIQPPTKLKTLLMLLEFALPYISQSCMLPHKMDLFRIAAVLNLLTPSTSTININFIPSSTSRPSAPLLLVFYSSGKPSRTLDLRKRR